MTKKALGAETTAFEGKVVHLIWGPMEYIGKIAQINHPAGPDWWRVVDPCFVVNMKDQAGNVGMKIHSISGLHRFFKPYIDIRIPAKEVLEMREVDKTGRLYEMYKEEINRKAPDGIITPDTHLVMPGGRKH